MLFQLLFLQLQFRQLLIESRKLLVFLEVSTPRTIALGFAAALRFWRGGFARLGLAPFLLALLLQKRAVVPFKSIKPSLVEAEQAINGAIEEITVVGNNCLLYTSPSPRDS